MRRDGHGASERSMREVMGMLRIAKSCTSEMTELRKRLRDMENALRLTENSAGARAQGDPLSETGKKLTDLCVRQLEQMNRRIELLTQKRATLDRLISALDDLEQRVITLRWVDGKSWRAIAMRIYMCERNGQRIQRRAIENMARALDAEEAMTQASP